MKKIIYTIECYCPTEFQEQVLTNLFNTSIMYIKNLYLDPFNKLAHRHNSIRVVIKEE